MLKLLLTQEGGRLPHSPAPVPATALVSDSAEQASAAGSVQAWRRPHHANVHLIKVENML